MNAQATIPVTAADLPLTCPPTGAKTWDAHPKVGLTLKDGTATCPYCGATYQLQGDLPKGHH